MSEIRDDNKLESESVDVLVGRMLRLSAVCSGFIPADLASGSVPFCGSKQTGVD